MDLLELQKHLRCMEAITNEEWLQSLNQRKRNELAFHDENRNEEEAEQLDPKTYEKRYGNKKYYGGTGLSNAYVDNWIKERSKGRVFLDYACGNGETAILAAKSGASLAIGIDISRVSVENARRFAHQTGVEGNIHFLQADAENTRLQDNSIDAILCAGVLHHLDLSFVFPELRRILVPGGRILAMEALDYNPAIKLYRRLTPGMRTEWETAHILSLKDLRFASRFFALGEVRYWHIASILHPFMKPTLPVLNAIDGIITRVPGVRLMAWMFTFELIKKEE